MGEVHEHELEHMGEDNEREKEKTDTEREQELEEHRGRIERILGSGNAENTRKVVAYIDELQRTNRTAQAVEIGEHAQDLVELDLGGPAPSGQGDALASREARDRNAAEAREPLDSAHTKRWYTRWKFWGFLGTTISTAAAIGATIFAGLALRQARPDDPDYDAIKAAREQLQKWRDMADPSFWGLMLDYVRDTGLSLETQTQLMNYVEVYFPSAFVPLLDGETIALRNMLVTIYFAHAVPGPGPMPCLFIYERLAQGLQGKRADTQEQSANLPRAQCADIAVMAFLEIRRLKGT